MNIADQLNSLLTIKNNIKLAIKAKGIFIDDDTPFSLYHDKINKINAIIDSTPPVVDFFTIVGNADKSATINGKTEAGATIVLKNPNNITVPLTVNADGSFTGTIAAVALEGIYTLTITDMSGNTTTITKNTSDPLMALFTGGIKGVYYDPSDLSTLFQDAAGTIPVTEVGQTVGKMLDKSGNNYHLVMDTVSRQPKLSKLANGVNYALQWDGVDDHMECPFTITADVPVVSMATTIEGPDAFQASFAFAVISNANIGSYLGRVKGNQGYANGQATISGTLDQLSTARKEETTVKSYAIGVRRPDLSYIYCKGGYMSATLLIPAALKYADNISKIGFGFNSKTLGKTCKTIMLFREFTESEITIITTALKASMGE